MDSGGPVAGQAFDPSVRERGIPQRTLVPCVKFERGPHFTSVSCSGLESHMKPALKVRPELASVGLRWERLGQHTAGVLCCVGLLA